jgi:hypothetical protein
MGSKSVTNVEVGDSETEIMDPTEVDAKVEKSFSVDNGDKEIIAIAWGSIDGTGWTLVDQKTIAPSGNGILVVGPNHFINVKLTGRTTTLATTSSVDATLTW